MRKLVLFVLMGTFIAACGAPKKLSKQDLERLNYEEVKEIAIDDQVLPDQYPMYPDGTKGYFQEVFHAVVYPPSLLDRGITGIVKVEFTVDEKGKVKDVHVVQSLHPKCDAEAIRVIKSADKWYPAIFEGEYVPVTMVMPFRFDPAADN